MFDFRRITPFCLEKHLSKHKITIFSELLGAGIAPLAPPQCNANLSTRAKLETKQVEEN